MSRADISSPWSLHREYENLKEARKASGELADKLKKDLFSSRSKVTEWGAEGEGRGGCPFVMCVSGS